MGIIQLEAYFFRKIADIRMPGIFQVFFNGCLNGIEFLGIKGIEINIGGTYNELRSEINKQYPGVSFPSLFTTNTPARLRMTTLYGIAAMFGGVVCNTCNLSEDWIGYSTKWGDAVGDFSLLNCLTKSEVVALGDTIGLPYELIHKVPSDGMCGKTDEDNLGFSYDELDAYIRSQPKYNINSEYDSNPNLLSGVVEKIEKMHFAPNTKKKCIELDNPFDYSSPWHLPTAF